MPQFNFTTGPATLPDVGTLSYNGCTFSSLFQTQVSGVYVKDAAKRTTEYIEYTITADGVATLPAGSANVEGVLLTMERLLSAQGGALTYSGRGIAISANAGGDRDVAWGPVPELMDIQPLGAGRSALVKWQVKTRIARVPPRRTRIRGDLGPVLQFNYETGVSYDDAGYSTLTIKGTLEIPLTRATQDARTVPRTADDFRTTYLDPIVATVDLTRFKVTRRDFTVSRDKRTLEFTVQAAEQSWMALPPDVTIARGTFTFRPSKAGMGLCNWLCSLNVTYTVAKGRPRNVAWYAFLALLRVRMQHGNEAAFIPGNQNPGAAALIAAHAAGVVAGPNAAAVWRALMGQQNRAQAAVRGRKVWLVDFSGSEGLYDDARTVTFSATWKLVTAFSEILLASGLWRKVRSHNGEQWAASVRNISGGASWLENRLDPEADVIVDFGS